MPPWCPTADEKNIEGRVTASGPSRKDWTATTLAKGILTDQEAATQADPRDPNSASEMGDAFTACKAAIKDLVLISQARISLRVSAFALRRTPLDGAGACPTANISSLVMETESKSVSAAGLTHSR